MRLSVLNFLLLTTVAIASSEERYKRHLPILMKWIKSALFGPEHTIIDEVVVPPSRPEYEVFRLPGHDDVVVKVSPKILNAEGVVYREVEPVNLKAFGAVVGIESPDDTIAAVREVDNLLSSGILYGGYDDVMKDYIVAMFPGIRTVDEEIVPIIESSEEEVELEVPVDKDSYEQLNDHEQAKIITADTKPGTELVETIKNKSHTLGPMPYPYSKHIEITDNLKTNDQPKPVVIAPSKEHSQSQFAKNVVVASENSEAKINKENNQEAQSEENVPASHNEIANVPAKSKTAQKKEDDQVRVQKQTTTSKPGANISDGKDNGYIYVNHPNPTKVNLVKESNFLKTNVKTNSNDNLEVVAPVKLELDKTDVTQSKHKPDEKVFNTNPLKTNEVKSLTQNPVLALNNVRNEEDVHQEHSKITEPSIKISSYQQKQADGSSMNVKGHKDDISVDFKGRGDIPEK